MFRSANYGCLIAGICAAVSTPVVAQTPAAQRLPSYRGRLLGVYNVETGEAIADADVIDVLNRVSAKTTKTGTVMLSFLPDGGALVKVQKLGFEATTIMVAISPADTVPFTVLLSPSAQRLPAVVTNDSSPAYVSPGLQAFEERRRSKSRGGYFIGELELRKSDNSSMESVLRRLPDLDFRCPKTGSRRGECWPIAKRVQSKLALLGGDCVIDVYVNGMVSTDNDVRKLPVSEFSGVEFYSGAASIPPEYNKTGSSCGVLLFWSRER